MGTTHNNPNVVYRFVKNFVSIHKNLKLIITLIKCDKIYLELLFMLNYLVNNTLFPLPLLGSYELLSVFYIFWDYHNHLNCSLDEF